MLPEIPQSLAGPVTAVALSILSIVIRSLGRFSMRSVGSDLSFSATSIHLSFLFLRQEQSTLSGSDLFAFIVFLVVWAVTLKFVQKSMDTSSAHANAFATLATVTGFSAVIAEMAIRTGL